MDGRARRFWGLQRRVIGKAEITIHGENPRFAVTSLELAPPALYR